MKDKDEDEIREEKKCERLFLRYAKEGNIQKFKEMIWHGQVDIHCVYKETYTSNGKDALFYALKGGHTELANYLINIGFDINHKGNTSGLISSIGTKLYFDVIDLLITHRWRSVKEIHGIVSTTLISNDKLDILVKYAKHYNIDPIALTIEHWKSEMPRVTDYYKTILQERIDNEKKLRREYKIATVLIETS